MHSKETDRRRRAIIFTRALWLLLEFVWFCFLHVALFGVGSGVG